MQKKMTFGKNIGNLLTAIFVIMSFTMIPSCKQELEYIETGFDILDNNRKTEFTFYAENPTGNQGNSPKAVKRYYAIGEEMSADDFFPKPEEIKQGYENPNWIFFPTEDASTEPSNIHKESNKIKFVKVTLQPLTFYAKDWVRIVKASYSVLFEIQNTDLQTYSDLKEYPDLLGQLGLKSYPEIAYGKPGTEMPNADYEMKEIRGFEFPPTIKPNGNGNLITDDGKAEVTVRYDRKKVAISIDLDGGTFEYEPRLEGYYGTLVNLPKFSKENYDFVELTFKENGETKSIKDIEKLTFPAEATDYKVRWKRQGEVEYTVRHWLQVISATEPIAEIGSAATSFESGRKTYYKYYSDPKTETLFGYPGEETDAQFATEDFIGNIGNYTRTTATITQRPIAADSSTVIDLYYDLIPIEVMLDPNGGTGTPITQTFYTETDCITIQSLESTGFEKDKYSFLIWNTKADGSGIGYSDNNAIVFTSQPTESITLYAQWKEIDKVNYSVRYMLQKISAETSNSSEGDIGTTEFVSGEKTYYKYYTTGSEIILRGFAGDYTQADFATAELITNIGNYTQTTSTITQKQISADGSTVVYVYYDLIPFEITLDPNDGDGNKITQTFYTETNCITIQEFASTGFSKTHHQFASWNARADGTGAISYTDRQPLTFTAAPTAPITLYTQWQEIAKVNYKIIHKLQNTDLNSYEVYETETKADFPNTAINAENFKKEYPGFTYTSSDSGTVTADGNAEFSVYYDRKEVTITINSEAGTFVGDSAATSKVLTGRYGTNVTSLPELAKTNYRFLGFVKYGTTETIATFGTFPAENEIYTVAWTEIDKATYKVRHLLQKVSATESNEAVEAITSGGKTYYTHYEVERETSGSGYPNETTTAQRASASLISNIGNYTPQPITQKTIAADDSTVVDVYYDVKPFEITLDAGDGTGTAITQTFYTETNCITIQASANTGFSKTHCQFANWNTKADGSGIRYSDEQAITFTAEPSEQITLYAQWVENSKIEYKIRHLLQKISATEPNVAFEIITSGGKTYYTYYEVGLEVSGSDYAGELTNAQFATAEMIPNIGNYTAIGTNVNNVGSGDITIEQKPIAANGSTVIDIYYNVKPFEITLNPNDGTGTSIKQTFYTETDCITIEKFANTGFARQYYEFTGWNTNSSGTGTEYADEAIRSFKEIPSTPITLYAQWKQTISLGNIDISFSSPDSTTISATIDNTSVPGQVTVTVTVPSNVQVSSYAWEIDGDRLLGESSMSLTIKESDYPIGYHTLICIVKDSSGKIYVVDGNFTVRK